MRSISTRLASEFRRARKVLAPLRRQGRQDSARVAKDVKDIQTLVESGHDPLHAAYLAVQNFASFFAEEISELDELVDYADIVGDAEEVYRPGGPPLSPLTGSYFTTWAFFDVRFGPDAETIGTLLVDLAELLEMDPAMAEVVRRFQETRMGIYEHRGRQRGRCRLRELVTGDEFSCHVGSGYEGRKGELWFARLCPPALGLGDYHVVFTTPYVLQGATLEDWTAYLRKSILKRKRAGERHALHDFLKYGTWPDHWHEFILQAYHHHQFDAIFLAGLPDVKESLPHAM